MNMSELFAKATGVLLEAEVAPDRRRDFEQRYAELTGEAPSGEFYKIQPNKWGIECRIYFDASEDVVAGLRELGLTVEERHSGYRSEKPYRVNNNDAFWELVQLGYSLGDQPAA